MIRTDRLLLRPGRYEAQDRSPLKRDDLPAYYGKGKDYYAFVTMLDCNLPRMKADAAKPAAERSGDAGYCLDPFEAKLKGLSDACQRRFTLGQGRPHRRRCIEWPEGHDEGAGRGEFLGKIDLDALAKM